MQLVILSEGMPQRRYVTMLDWVITELGSVWRHVAGARTLVLIQAPLVSGLRQALSPEQSSYK